MFTAISAHYDERPKVDKLNVICKIEISQCFWNRAGNAITLEFSKLEPTINNLVSVVIDLRILMWESRQSNSLSLQACCPPLPGVNRAGQYPTPSKDYFFLWFSKNASLAPLKWNSRPPHPPWPLPSYYHLAHLSNTKYNITRSPKSKI